MVLDAKYKGYSDWNQLQREDLYQVISYMHVLNKSKGGFIVPVGSKNEVLQRKLNGVGGTLSIYGMDVSCKDMDYYAFIRNISRQEAILKQQIINL